MVKTRINGANASAAYEVFDIGTGDALGAARLARHRGSQGIAKPAGPLEGLLPQEGVHESRRKGIACSQRVYQLIW